MAIDTGLLTNIGFYVSIAIVFSVLALGFNLQWGYTGLFNAGIAGFFLVGAYVTAIAITPLSPPIIIGGNGFRLLTLAAKEADTVNLTGITFTQGGTVPDMSGWKVAGIDERMRVVREAAGQRLSRLELSAQLQRVIVTDRRREAAEELQKSWKQLSVEEILEAPYVLIGTVDEMVEALHARRDRWGISYFVTFEPYLETLAPIVARLAGK